MCYGCYSVHHSMTINYYSIYIKISLCFIFFLQLCTIHLLHICSQICSYLYSFSQVNIWSYTSRRLLYQFLFMHLKLVGSYTQLCTCNNKYYLGVIFEQLIIFYLKITQSSYALDALFQQSMAIYTPSLYQLSNGQVVELNYLPFLGSTANTVCTF